MPLTSATCSFSKRCSWQVDSEICLKLNLNKLHLICLLFDNKKIYYLKIHSLALKQNVDEQLMNKQLLVKNIDFSVDNKVPNYLEYITILYNLRK